MENKKFAYELKPGDKLESTSGILTVVRAHRMDKQVSMIGVVAGQLTKWGHYNSMDQFDVLTVH